MRLVHVSIGGKIIAGFTIVFLGMAALGAIGVQGLVRVNAEALSVRDDRLPAIGLLGKLAAEVQQHRVTVAQVLLSGTEDAQDQAARKLAAVESKIARLRADFEPRIRLGTDDERLMHEFDRFWAAYLPTARRAIEARQAGDLDEMETTYLNAGRRAFNAAFNPLTGDMEFAIAQGQLAGERGEQAFRSTSRIMFATIAAVALLCLSAVWAIVRGVSTPVRRMTGVITRIAAHDLAGTVPDQRRGDEIGRMAKAVEAVRVSLIEADRLRAGQESAKAGAAVAQQVAMAGMADEFETAIGSIVGTVAAAATQLHGTAAAMATVAEDASRQAGTVATAAGQASADVGTVAAAAEQLATSIREIAGRVARSAAIATSAVQQAQQTNRTVEGLTGTAGKIGQIVGLIQNIASQTNLLALNATIEAARAGDAGKGFAVVASEVKALANQTSAATEDIARQVAAIQGSTTGVVDAIRSIGRTIDEINQMASAIADAVEQQGSATREIAGSVALASNGTALVTSNIGAVTRASGEVGAAAGQVLGASTELSRQSEMLRREVGQFLSGIRAA